MPELFLVRHGKTPFSEQRLYCGSSNPPLSDMGRQDLTSAAGAFCYPACDLYLTSSRQRAIQTCSILLPGCQGRSDPVFDEMDFGEFEGHSYEQLKNDPGYLAWLSDKEGTVHCPGGESRQEFALRMQLAYQKLTEALAGMPRVLLVCHGGVICSLMDMMFPGERMYFSWQPDFGMGYRVLFSQEISPLSYQPLLPAHAQM